MTTPTNWPNPERPGYPMFPERDGWHWLSNCADETPFPAEWSHEDYSDGHTEWSWDMGEEQVDAYEMRGLYYRGLCPLPGAEDEATRIALNNIRTLTEQARKNIAVTSGARKMAKAIFPILADIDRQVDAVRSVSPTFTPTQINEMLAGERERCADVCSAMSFDNAYEKHARAALEDAEIAIYNLGDAP